MTPSVSVILATHDRGEALSRAVASALAQTQMPAEIVIVNDGRDEVPAELIKRIRAAGVVAVLRRLERPSLPASRNAGVAAAGGDVLLLMDDDHELPPDYLARLAALYGADTAGQVDAIGGFVVERPRPLRRRVWDVLMWASAHHRWRPRRCRARYVSLPPRLRGRLAPATYLTGGTVSLRRRAANEVRFNERLRGYALGEDRDFSYRATQRLAVFAAPSLQMTHHRGAGHREDPAVFGRTVVSNFVHIASDALEGGAGKWLLLAWNLAGLAAAHALYAVVGERRRHRRILSGMIRALWALATGKSGDRP